MSRIRTAALASLFMLVSGCSSTGGQQRPNARSINYDEASAFERSLLARELQSSQNPEPVYIQPANKNEPCKLPTTANQLSRGNFRAYWDGQCKNGYAYGLGRDIAISDTHHVEEITIHNGSAGQSSTPIVDYDFVNKKVIYAVPEGEYPAATRHTEFISNDGDQFNVHYALMVSDKDMNIQSIEYSPLSPVRILMNSHKKIGYKFIYNPAIPIINPTAATFTAEIVDPNTRTAGGVAIVLYGNGSVRNLKLNGSTPEEVILPKEYLDHINEEYRAVDNIQATAFGKLEPARQMEREYLYMACNGKHTIDGLDKEVYTKICNWRSQFKVPYENALAKYTQQMKQFAEAAERKRTEQKQVAQRQKRETQEGLLQLFNGIGQIGQQMQNSSQQMLQNTTTQPFTQVRPFTPFTPAGDNHIGCVNSGSVTNCVYR